MDIASTLNKHLGLITDSLNLFSWPEDTSMSKQAMTKLTSLLKKVRFNQV